MIPPTPFREIVRRAVEFECRYQEFKIYVEMKGRIAPSREVVLEELRRSPADLDVVFRRLSRSATAPDR